MLRGLIVSLSVVSATACGSGKAAQATVPPPANTSTTTTTPTGIVVLFEAQHLWIGNQSWWTKERSKTDGYYAEVVAGLDALGKADVPGAKVELIAYGVDAVVLWKGVLRDLTGDRIGS
jgi:hypothetical protein